MLTLKPTDLPCKPDNDYEVFDETKKSVGRIFLDIGMPAGSPEWYWGTMREPNWAGHDRGHAASFEEAKAAFKKSWEAGPLRKA